MKINLVLPGFGTTGGIKVALRYADALSKAGHDVVCYAPRVIYDLGKHKKLALLARRIYRIFFPADIKATKHQYPKLKLCMPFFIRNNTIRNADKTIATAWCTAYDVNGLSEEKGEKIYFIQGYEVWDDKLRGQESYKFPMKHVVISKWIDNILVNKLGCNPGIIVHNGIDIDIFKGKKEKENSNTVHFLMLYHKLSKKGVDDGLAAYKWLKDKYNRTELNMFGQYPFVNKPDFVDNYYLNPTIDKLVQLYQDADVFIFPSREEGWGLTPVEAMACECAVAGTNVGCMLEIGENGENVLLSEPYDTKQLYVNLERLFLEKDLRMYIAKNGLETAKKLNWEKAYMEFLTAINS